MMRSRTSGRWPAAFSAAVTSLALIAANALAQAPPPLVSLQPMAVNLLRPQGLEIAPPPAPGQWRLALATAYGNTFSGPHQVPDAHVLVDGWRTPLSRAAFELAEKTWPDGSFYFIDAEVIRTDLEGAYSPSRRITVGFDVPWVRWGGTGLDTLADHVHTLIGTTHGARPAFTYGETRVAIQRNGRSFYLDRPPSDGLGNLSGWLAVRLGEWGGWGHRVMVEVKAPTATATVLGADAWDWGLRWAAGRSLGRFRLGGGLGWTHLGGGVPTLADATDTWHVWFAAGAPLCHWMDLDALVRVDTSPYWHSTPGQLHKAAVELALGPTFRLGRGFDLQAALGENLPAVGIAPDFSIQLRLLWLRVDCP